MMVVKASLNAVFRGADLRPAAMAVTAALSLSACASTSPQMAARPAMRQASAGAQPAPRYNHAPPRPMRQASAADAPGGAPPPAEGGGRYKLGAPYQAAGLWYVPADQPNYDEVGIASWYGDQEDGKPTANGERFDARAASAAHTTLPLPSIVEVTNLDNGRTIRVRLNDRGPFKAGRVIDLSRGAAQELGYLEKGTARVRVRYVGPARLDGSLEPLYVAQGADAPSKSLQLAAAALPPPPASAAWSASPLAPPAAPVRRPDVAAPFTAPVSAPVPVRAALPAGGDGFAVQAGAFSDQTKARRIADSLATAGSASVRPVDLADRRLYRVVVGPWRDAGQAEAARAQVIALGFADARIVKAF